jgi:hypothetical protein
MAISADATWRENIKRVKNNKDGTVVSLVYIEFRLNFFVGTVRDMYSLPTIVDVCSYPLLELE